MARMNLVAEYTGIGGGPHVFISVTNDSGSAIEGLTESKFIFQTLAGPTGLGGAQSINAGVATPSRPGVYWFSLQLPAGAYVIAITMTGYKGWSKLEGQTLLKFTVT
jgi:hypothetical protein